MSSFFRHQVSSLQRPGPASTPGGASVSSTSSIMDTIARVANGVMDTDSDTLSAPSPPPTTNSATVATVATAAPPPKHTKAHKKAWLQRYTDDTITQTTSVESPAPAVATPIKQENHTVVAEKPPAKDSLNSSSSPIAGKDCKEEKSGSPPTVAPPSVKKEEESTTSASENETSMAGVDKPGKKKVKRKKEQPPSETTTTTTTEPAESVQVKTEPELQPSAAKKPKLEVKLEVKQEVAPVPPPIVMMPVLPASIKQVSRFFIFSPMGLMVTVPLY